MAEQPIITCFLPTQACGAPSTCAQLKRCLAKEPPPSKRALREAAEVVYALSLNQGRDEYQVYKIALALDRAWREALEGAAHFTACRSPFEHPTVIAAGIRALADREPGDG